MNNTKIEWCDMTWNPVTGCKHGCEYCYARRIAERFAPRLNDGSIAKVDGVCDIKNTNIPYPYGFAPTFYRNRLSEPQHTKKPQNIFVCSMADLFGEWVPQEWIDEIRVACSKADWHNYLFLTKNPSGYEKIYKYELDYSPYFWFGTTVTDDASFAERGYELFEVTHGCRQPHRFLSIEPLHGQIKEKSLRNACLLDWIIIGAETGNRKGKVTPKREWIDDIVSACDRGGVPVFMKNSLIPIMGEENMRREFPKGMKGVNT